MKQFYQIEYTNATSHLVKNHKRYNLDITWERIATGFRAEVLTVISDGCNENRWIV